MVLRERTQNGPMFKRVLSCIVALVASFNFFGCKLKSSSEEEIAVEMESTLTRLFSAVEDCDQETFNTFFADHVISLPDFEVGRDYVFDCYQGGFVSITTRAIGSSGTHIVPGEHIDYVYMTFDLITTEKEYLVRVEFYTKYESKYPNDSYKIRKFSLLSKLDNGDFENHGNGFSQRYGISYPGWVK